MYEEPEYIAEFSNGLRASGTMDGIRVFASRHGLTFKVTRQTRIIEEE